MKIRTIFALLSFCTLNGLCRSDDCGTSEIMKCLPAFTHEGDQFPDTRHKLMEHCKQVLTSVECAKQIIDSCSNAEEKKMYHNLTHDMIGMNVELCTSGSTLNTKFLRHVNCYRDLSDKFKVCTDRYIGNIVIVHGLNQEEQVKMTCCNLHEYNRCMRNVVSGRCDKEAQELVENNVVGTLVAAFRYCDQIGDYPTTNCMKMFSETHGHATGNLEENSQIVAASSLTIIIISLLASLSLSAPKR